MAHPYHHALSSVKKWGGQAEDYLPIHNWFDASKAFLADFRHRALRHHAEGIFWVEEVFGVTITNSDGKAVPVRITWPWGRSTADCLALVTMCLPPSVKKLSRVSPSDST